MGFSCAEGKLAIKKLCAVFDVASFGKAEIISAINISFDDFEDAVRRHHVEIISKCKNIGEAIFYVNETVQKNWSRSAHEDIMNATLKML